MGGNKFSHLGDSPKWVKSKRRSKKERNTPGTAGGLGGRDRMLAVKEEKTPKNQFFSRKKIKNYFKNIFFCIHLLVMPKYWGKQIFSLGSFPKVGQKQKTEKKKKKEERTMAITMASYAC